MFAQVNLFLLIMMILKLHNVLNVENMLERVTMPNVMEHIMDVHVMDLNYVKNVVQYYVWEVSVKKNIYVLVIG